MSDNLATMSQTAGFYANTREERQAARLALAEACAHVEASLDDLKTALDAAGLLLEDK